MARVVSVFLPSWPTDRLRRTWPDAPPRDRPFATAAQVGQRRIIGSACIAARKAGVRVAMSVAEANAFVAGLVIADADPEGDEEGLRQLALRAARRLSPVAAPDDPDGIVIDVTGCAHLFGGEAAMLDLIVRRLRRAGFWARAGIADTWGAAHALARFGGGAMIVVPPGQTAAALAPLPLGALRIEPETAAALKRFGLKRIEQLLAAPRAPFTLRFGEGLIRRLDQALGHAGEPIPAVVPQDAPRVRAQFLDPVITAEGLEFAAGRLIADLTTSLSSRCVGARRLDLLFERVDQTTLAVRAGLARPSRDAHHFAKLLMEKLDKIDLGFGVEAMTLIAARWEPLAARQTATPGFANGDGEDLAELVDRVSVRANVFAVEPVESHAPERTVRRVDALAAKTQQSWPSWPRPYWLFVPELLRTTALMPDAPPAQFLWRGQSYRVRRADGPERIHLEWWRAPSEISATRDYYRVEDEAGGRYWLFREGRTNETQWYLHGVFG